MITLKEACKIVLSKHPLEYIHCVNEYDETYQFILGTKGEKFTNGSSGLFDTPGIYKNTGELKDDAWLGDDIFKGDYKQYSSEDLDKLL